MTRPKFGMVEYLSTKSSDTKVLSKNSTCKRKNKLQVQTARLNKKNVRKKERYCYHKSRPKVPHLESLLWSDSEAHCATPLRRLKKSLFIPLLDSRRHDISLTLGTLVFR